MYFDMDEKKIRQQILKNLVETNDACFIALGNYIDDLGDEMDVEFAVAANEDELFNMFAELFKNETVRAEARKAILFSDYGKTDDSLDIN